MKLLTIAEQMQKLCKEWERSRRKWSNCLHESNTSRNTLRNESNIKHIRVKPSWFRVFVWTSSLRAQIPSARRVFGRADRSFKSFIWGFNSRIYLRHIESRAIWKIFPWRFRFHIRICEFFIDIRADLWELLRVSLTLWLNQAEFKAKILKMALINELIKAVLFKWFWD